MNTAKKDEPTTSSTSAPGAADTNRAATQDAKESAKAATEAVQDTAKGAGESVQQAADDLRRRAGDAYQQASDWAQEQYQHGARQFERTRSRSMERMQQARGGVERFVSDNPVMVGVLGLAAGLIIGALLPRTRREDRAFGRFADEVRDQGMRYVRGATQRGREYMEEALDRVEPRVAGRDEEWCEEGDRRRGGTPGYRDH